MKNIGSTIAIFASLILMAACAKQPSPSREQQKDVPPSPPAPQVEVPGAVLDIEFNDDGSASDVSGNSISITPFFGANMVTYYNADAGRNAARFYSQPGSNVSEGYYKIDYYYNKTLREALKDGHSLEVQFMMARPNPGERELKMFSATDGGGTGIMLTSSTRGGEITFLPNIGRKGASGWVWTQSGIAPEVGKYYHVVGVWDKQNACCRIYVNGELCRTVDADGDLVFPSDTKSRWFCVGGDATPTSAESAWNGDVVIARVYDQALSTEQVGVLWEAADREFRPSPVKIENVLMLPVCNVRPGGRFTVCADGFESGDRLSLISPSTGYSKECETALGEGKAVLTLPSDIQSGIYKVFVVRGSDSTPIGSVNFVVGDSETIVSAPGIVAHRGFHGGSVPENSIEALVRAQQGGYYGSEMDVWITTDGVVYVNHDGVISGKRIQDCSSAELKDIRLSNGEPLPLFADYLRKASGTKGGTRLVIEFKEHHTEAQNDACVDEVLRIVREQGMDEYVDYIGAGLSACKRAAAARPDNLVGYLTATSDIEGLHAAGISNIDFSYTALFEHPEYITKAHELGMTVDIWTIDTEYEMLKAIGYGADFITTNRPDLLQQIIDRIF